MRSEWGRETGRQTEAKHQFYVFFRKPSYTFFFFFVVVVVFCLLIFPIVRNIPLKQLGKHLSFFQGLNCEVSHS